MIRRYETDPIERDEKLGEAIEAFLALAEAGPTPDPEEFAARYPELGDDLRAALDGLALVRGLVGDPSGPENRLEAGRRVAGYRIVRELGRGGMGIVYEAVHVDLDRPVALKVLGTHAAPDSIGRRRFLNEARTAAGLHHTHIVPVFDVGQVGGLCYYAMQRIEGCGLDRVLRALRRNRSTAASSSGAGATARASAPAKTHGASDGQLSLSDATASWVAGGRSGEALGKVAGRVSDVRAVHDGEPPPFEPPHGVAYYKWVAQVGRDAAEALEHAHGRGIIHRDIKPSNLLADARGSIWVADFGLARRLADPSMTQTDSLLGTPRYMSPEQAENLPVDARTDVYSLAATLYELLTLRPPFEGRTVAELSKQITGREPIALRRFDSRIPRDLETIVLKAMAKRPADRYATAAELADDLGRFLGLEPVRARRIGPLGRLWRVARRHPGITTVTAVAAATVLAVATVAYVRIVQERDLAIRARRAAQIALEETVKANRKTQAAMREQLLSSASVTRMSTLPKRRDRGLDLLKRAVELGPDPTQRLRLRDEAVEYLALRDVEQQLPEIATGKTRGLVFGSGGTRLATLSDEGSEFRLWDVTRRELLAGPLRSGPDSATGNEGGPRRGQGIAALGNQLAAVWPNGHGIRLFEPSTGTLVADLPMPDREIVSLFAVPGDQPRLVTIELLRREKRRDPDGVVINLWDPSHIDAPLKTLAEASAEAPGPPPSAFVAIQPDGETIATAWTRKPIVSLWSPVDGRPLGEDNEIDTQASWITALALGPDGVLAVGTRNGSIQLWDVESQAPLPSLNYQGFVRLLRFSPDGSLLAVAGWDSGVELWDPSASTLGATLPAPSADRVSDMSFSSDGQTLVVSQGPSVAIWAIHQPMGRVRLAGFKEVPSSLAFGLDGRLAMASRGSALRIWCPNRCPTTNEAWDEAVPTSVAFDQEGLLVALDAESLRWYQSPDGACVRQVRLPELLGPWNSNKVPRMPVITAMTRSADGQTLALTRGSEVLVWSSGTPDVLNHIRIPRQSDPTHPRPERGRGGAGAPWRDLALSPSGDRLYLCNMLDEIFVGEFEGNRITRLDWPLPHDVTSLALSPNGLTLALGDRAGGVVLVDTTRGIVQTRLPSPTEEDEGDVKSLAFSPNGNVLAVGTQHGPIRLWMLGATPEPLMRLPSHRGAVTTLAFDQSGHRLASSGYDKTVVVWDLERLGKELTALGMGW